MIHVNSITLRNVVSFRKAKLKVTKSPLTFVFGRNHDADDEEGITGNGTGKSLLFSSIPNLRYSAPPTARAKKSKKDLLYKKGAQIGLSLTNHEGSYDLVQHASGFDVHLDGADQQIKRIPDAEKYIAEILPLSDVEFYTTCFLATNRKFSMQSATDSERLEYFTSIFKFDFFDKLQSYFSKQARAIKDDEIRMQVLEQNLLSLETKTRSIKRELKGIDLDSLAESQANLDAKVRKINDKLFELNRLHAEASNLVTVTRRLDKLMQRYTADSSPKNRASALKAMRAASREWRDYARDKARWSELKAELEAEQKSLRDRLPSKMGSNFEEQLCARLDEAQAELDKVNEQLRAEEQKFRDHKALNKQIVSLDRLIGDCKESSTAEDLESEIARCKITLKLQHFLSKHDAEEGHGAGSECPTCLSQVDLNSVRRAVKSAVKALPALEQRLEIAQALVERKELKRKLKTLAFDKSVGEDLYEASVAEKADVSTYQQHQETYRSFVQVERKLKKLDRPEKPNSDKPDIEYDAINEELELCLEILTQQEAQVEILSSVDLSEHGIEGNKASLKAVLKAEDSVRREVESLEAELKKVQTKLSSVNGTLTTVNAKKAEFDLYKRERLEAQAEADKLRPNLEKKKIVDSLLKFYSSKGQRAKAADAICTLLEANLNMYRELIFVEPFEFTVEAKESGISMLVDRGNGHKTDVRFLSAAEADCFSCLHLLSILPLIHDSRRLNMAVLDEPMCHAHEVTRRVFRDKFLPVLCTVVPHVFVITQNEDDYIDGSRKIHIIKECGVSRIEDVHKTN